MPFSAVGFCLVPVDVRARLRAEAGLAGRPGLGSLPGAVEPLGLGSPELVRGPAGAVLDVPAHLSRRSSSDHADGAIPLAAATLGGALMVLGVVGRDREVQRDDAPLVPPGWAALAPRDPAQCSPLGLALAAAAAFAGLGALVLRSRSSTHEERQRLRLLW